ncbi:MAG: hypothetical protein LBR32_09530 [Propionibacteriaceae bacterium]|jgi:hypothetical protein|nr:hypothetical protein [Propionibacteriaceae bacterium]
MCRRVTCRVCGKTTWAGCGQHIAAVKATVPKDQWCSGQHSDAERAAAQPTGLFQRLFG